MTVPATCTVGSALRGVPGIDVVCGGAVLHFDVSTDDGSGVAGLCSGQGESGSDPDGPRPTLVRPRQRPLSDSRTRLSHHPPEHPPPFLHSGYDCPTLAFRAAGTTVLVPVLWTKVGVDPVAPTEKSVTSVSSAINPERRATSDILTSGTSGLQPLPPLSRIGPDPDVRDRVEIPVGFECLRGGGR